MPEFYSFECELCPQDSEEDSKEEKVTKYLTRLMILPKKKYLTQTDKGRLRYGSSFVTNYKYGKSSHCNLLHDGQSGFPAALTPKSLVCVSLTAEKARRCKDIERDRKKDAREGRLKQEQQKIAEETQDSEIVDPKDEAGADDRINNMGRAINKGIFDRNVDEQKEPLSSLHPPPAAQYFQCSSRGIYRT